MICKPFDSLACVFLVVAASISLPATAAGSSSNRTEYKAPPGFAGRNWGELRTSFDRLPEEPLGVGAAYILPQLKQNGTSLVCVPGPPLGPQMNGAYQSCDYRATLDRIQRNYEGGGFYVLSEYSIPEQGFRWGDEAKGVVIHPVVYQFCANWHKSLKKKEVPPNFDQINKLCGIRLVFQSETRDELAKLPASHVTVYDRMLDLLVNRFGAPAHFSRRGQVIIETEDGETTEAAARKFSIWRWCPAKFNGLHTDCKASVTLSINPATGQGTVLYATPLLWEYAWARENNGFKGDRLFKLLHAPK